MWLRSIISIFTWGNHAVYDDRFPPADWQPLFSVRVVPGVVVTAITGICSSQEKPDSIPGTIPSDGLKPDGGLLDGVVFSGGEPLLQKQLPEAIGQIHQNGFEVALHTSGVYPERLSKVLPLIEWVGLDIKAPFDEYELITGGGNGQRAKDSLIRILDSGKDFELRCTVDPLFFNPDNAGKMARQLMELGVSHLVLQPYRDLVNRRTQAVSKEIIASIEQFFRS